jgi:predicted small secreted protein
MRKSMQIFFTVVALAGMLAGCETARQDRQLTGGLIGGAAGATIGGLATRSTGGALVGGLLGGAAGAIIADETRPRRGRCYARTDTGRLVRVRC